MGGIVDALLVVAPKAVHPNWANDELPIHMWDDVDYKTLCWSSSKVKNKSFKRSYDSLLKYEGLSVITMNYESLLSKNTHDMISKFLETRNVMMVCDESHRIKNPQAKTTKKILKLAKFAKCRWILSGTPFAKNPFDIYSQLNFMDPDILDQKSYFAFKNYFGEFQIQYAAGGRSFQDCVGFRNLDVLKNKVAEHSSRVLKNDVLDLPPKLFDKRYIDMPPEMAKAYKQMKEEFILELDSGDIISAPLAISKLGKLQQIVSGFVFDEVGNVIPISTVRVDALIDELTGKKTIIWAKFKEDIRMIQEGLTKAGVNFVTYVGDTSDADREHARTAFQNDPEVIVFLGSPGACREGLTLHAAEYVLNFNRDFNYINNVQSEDRAHRIGQEKNVLYIDFIMNGTVDEAIIDNLRSKDDMASKMNSDTIREWI